MGRNDRGQATVLWAAMLLLVGLLLVPTGRLIRATAERSAAQTVADVTALGAAAADVGDRRDRAEELATANGATLTTFDESPADDGGIDVTVTVRVGDFEATARARREVTCAPPTGEPDRWEPG